MIIVLLLICFFGIEGTSYLTITTHRGLFMMMMIGLMLSEMKNKGAAGRKKQNRINLSNTSMSK